MNTSQKIAFVLRELWFNTTAVLIVVIVGIVGALAIIKLLEWIRQFVATHKNITEDGLFIDVLVISSFLSCFGYTLVKCWRKFTNEGDP